MTAVTAVTVQNSLGVTGYTEIPPDVVAAQIEAVASDIGVEAAKTGMLASAAIITAIAPVLDRVHIGQSGAVPFVVDPVAASMHGDQLLAQDALDALRTLLFPRATLVTPNLDEVRLLTGITVRDRAEQRKAAEALHALGPRWVLVKGGHLHDDPDAWTCSTMAGSSPSCPAPATTPGTPTAAATPWPRRSAPRWPVAHRCRRPSVRQALGDRMSARRISVGAWPRPSVGAFQAHQMNLEQIAGTAHEPADHGQGAPIGVVVLTHGAGGSRESPLLLRICDSGPRAVGSRCGTCRRRRRPKGPPSNSAASDQAGIVEAIEFGDGPSLRARSSRAGTRMAAG